MLHLCIVKNFKDLILLDDKLPMRTAKVRPSKICTYTVDIYDADYDVIPIEQFTPSWIFGNIFSLLQQIISFRTFAHVRDDLYDDSKINGNYGSTELKNHNDFCVQDMVCYGDHSEDKSI